MTILTGTVDTEIYAAEGFVAVKQPKIGQEAAVILLSSDQLPLVITELQALYDSRAEWQETALE